METNRQKYNRKDLELVVGCILLIPSLISVLFFFIQFIEPNVFKNFKETAWTGDYGYSSSGGGGYASALPIYLGLTAIAGAYLIKDNKK
jgi:hypothetical protein